MPGLPRPGLQRLPAEAAGDVEQGVQAAEAVGDRVDGGAGGHRVGEVDAALEEGPRADLIGDGGVGGEVDQRDLRAGRGGGSRHRRSQDPGRTSDCYDASGHGQSLES